MNKTIRNIQLTAVLVVLISTVIAFFLEIKEMYDNQNITLADLLLMFIYIEVIGLVKSYWETRAVRITYPLVIAITALARFIILQDKESDPANLIYISFAILIVALATVIIRFRNSKYLKIDKSKSSEL
jgi:protein PsiE